MLSLTQVFKAFKGASLSEHTKSITPLGASQCPCPCKDCFFSLSSAGSARESLFLFTFVTSIVGWWSY